MNASIAELAAEYNRTASVRDAVDAKLRAYINSHAASTNGLTPIELADIVNELQNAKDAADAAWKNLLISSSVTAAVRKVL